MLIFYFIYNLLLTCGTAFFKNKAMSKKNSVDKILLPGKEYPEKNEEKIAEKVIKLLQDQMLRMYANKKKQFRQIHPKMNGCVKAEFIVENNLPEELRVGLFHEHKSFP